MISPFSAEALTIPATVPVPNRRITTPATFPSPNSEYATVFRQAPQATQETIPPTGSATIGSTDTPAIGRRARSVMTATGPAIAANTPGVGVRETGPPVSTGATVSTSPAAFRLASQPASTTVTTRAQRAGTALAAISAVKSTLNASAAAMVLGLGEMIFPAFPPPTIANSNAETGREVFLPTASATGATVITAMSMNTPTAPTIIVASAMAASANRAPSRATTVSAILTALPVWTNAPTRTPDARIRSTLGIIPFVPSIIAVTVSTSPPPPSRPPTSDPKTSAYTGVTFRMIRRIATLSPINAPQVVNI